MAKSTLYLKYRPFQLDDVIGQDYVTSTLKQASIQNRFAHAYLFGGIRGTSKTTSGRILANLLTCSDVKNGVLCGKCPACLKIPSGNCPDFIELDGAKNGNVENVQELIESARWSPNELKRKVYLIDECHQLTPRAISAMLKIVEEPPEYVSFIFCTTETDKIPVTILSRAQRFTFYRISVKNIATRLRFISDKENILIDDAALYSIARLGRGSMRDAIVCLEQISTSSGQNKIDENLVNKYYGMADRKGIFDIVKSIIECNVSVLMDQVNDMIICSSDVKGILYEISELFRNLMVLKAQKGNTKLIDLPEHEINILINLGASIKFNQLEKLSRAFATIEKELDFSINKRWVLESTLLRCAAYLRQQ